MPRFFQVTLAVTLLTVVAAFAADSPPIERDLLDGLQFEGMTGEKGRGDHHADTITFKNGTFRSLDCENWGFGPAPYTVEKKGDALFFTSTLLSPKRGRLDWKGKIVDGKATATFRWKHERWYWNIDREYWFEGTPKTAQR